MRPEAVGHRIVHGGPLHGGPAVVTRSGSVDPGLLLWLQQDAGTSLAELADGLEHHAGLAGLSGTSGGMRDVRAAAEAGSRDAQLAVEVYLHRLAREAAAMAVAAGGLDAPHVRADLAARLSYLGVAVDDEANRAARTDTDIGAAGEPSVRTLVVTTREDLEIARQVRACLT